MTLTSSDVLFVGLGRSVPCWYRIALPASQLGCDWIGVSDDPPREDVVTGNVMTPLDPNQYAVYVLQQPKGAGWLRWIREAKRGGARIIYEIDDWVRAAPYVLKRGERVPMSNRLWLDYTMCMNEADGIICSTDFLATKLMEVTPQEQRIWVCRNGIDLGRYHLTPPKREVATWGWFGAANHEVAMEYWLPVFEDVKRKRPHNPFVVIGHSYPELEHLADVRIPFVHLENLPGALANLDVAFAPAMDNDFGRAKSDLRFLECAAARVAGVFDAVHYNIPAGCGQVAYDHDDAVEHIMYLLDHPDLRERITGEARGYVETHRDDAAAAEDWVNVMNELAKEDQ